jgi:hypothetical protein
MLVGRDMEMLEWQKMLLKLSKLRKFGAISGKGSGSLSQRVKKEIFSKLNLENDKLNSPLFGELLIKVASKKTKHSNISTSISPVYEEDWSNLKLLHSYGVVDKNGHEKSLMTAFRTESGKSSLPLYIQVKNDKIILRSVNEIVAHWKKKDVIDNLSKKSNIFLIRFEKDSIGYHIFSVKVVHLDITKLDFDFINLINDGKIACETRMYIATDHHHCMSRGFVTGSLRNHGFGWRIKENVNSKLFTVIDLIN